MQDHTLETGVLVIGLDVGDVRTHVLALDSATAEIVEDGKLATTRAAMHRRFQGAARARIVLEAGTHSRWLTEQLASYGHEVLVANPRRVQLIAQSNRKNDRLDALMLARLGRSDPQLLSPITHRGAAAQQDLAVLRARDALVEVRTKLVNHVRTTVKCHGGRVPKCDAATFHKVARTHLPPALEATLTPVLTHLEALTASIREYDRTIERTVAERYPETARVTQVAGIGSLTGLAFVLTLERPSRFRRCRAVGPYLGLVPRLRDSGGTEPGLGITKAGNGYLRRLLVNAAQYILGPFGPDTDLRRWGLRLAEHGGKHGKKRAVIAVARKLAVLLLRLWETGEPYEPLRQAHATERAQARAARATEAAGRATAPASVTR